MRLIKENSPLRKPQCQFSESVRQKSQEIVRDWFMSFELPGYQANLLAAELVDRAVRAKIAAVPSSAPDVYIGDADKVLLLEMEAKRMADKLDQEEKLDALLGELEEADSQNEGNSL